MASSLSKRRLGKCTWCGSKDYERQLGTLWSGKTVAMCTDGTACVRRRMAADGVELLPHPKNP